MIFVRFFVKYLLFAYWLFPHIICSCDLSPQAISNIKEAKYKFSLISNLLDGFCSEQIFDQEERIPLAFNGKSFLLSPPNYFVIKNVLSLKEGLINKLNELGLFQLRSMVDNFLEECCRSHDNKKIDDFIFLSVCFERLKELAMFRQSLFAFSIVDDSDLVDINISFCSCGGQHFDSLCDLSNFFRCFNSIFNQNYGLFLDLDLKAGLVISKSQKKELFEAYKKIAYLLPYDVNKNVKFIMTAFNEADVIYSDIKKVRFEGDIFFNYQVFLEKISKHFSFNFVDDGQSFLSNLEERVCIKIVNDLLLIFGKKKLQRSFVKNLFSDRLENISEAARELFCD